MILGIDIMGGDYAPDAVLLGIAQALKKLTPETKLLLIGNEHYVKNFFGERQIPADRFDYFHTEEVIGMDEHPVKSFASKRNSSIVKGFEFLKQGKIQAFASAGNTGAMMAGVMTVVKPAPGVIRPCLAIQIPRIKGNPGIILDVGLNPDAKPEVLFQYGIIGALYATQLYSLQNPKVALLNIGGEESKGNLTTKAAHQLMKNNEHFNFVGNVEGNDIFDTEKSDVIVCDGFTGNIILKQAEAFYNLYSERKMNDEFFERFNFENFGGTPILGINANVIIAHGHSNPKAIESMIIQTSNIAAAKVSEKISEHFSKIQVQ
jgi:glycerol-3-phosphate acyltransferase PlsX